MTRLIRTHVRLFAACAAVALAGDAALAQTTQPFARDDAVFGTSNTNAFRTTKQVKANFSVKDSGTVTGTSWNQRFIQSVEFDNLNGLRHNSGGNILGLNFGAANQAGVVTTPGSLSTLATRGIVAGQTAPAASALLYTFNGMNGSELVRVGGVSASPRNTRIGLTTGDVGGKVIVLDYTAAPAGDAVGASVTNYRSIAVPGLNARTSATTWLNSNSLLVVGNDTATGDTGDLYRVDVATDGSLSTTEVANNLFAGFNLTFTNVTYEPTISPFAFVSGSGFSGGTINRLIVVDPRNSFAPVTDLLSFSPAGAAGTADGEINTLRETAFDSKGNLVLGAFIGSTALGDEYGIKSLVAGYDAATLTSNSARLVGILRKDQTSDAVSTSTPPILGTSSSFNGIDVAMTNVDYVNADVAVNLGTADLIQQYFGGSPVALVIAKLAAGTIGSSDAPAGGPTAIGYIDRPNDGPGGTIRFAYTLKGDADLSKIVGFADLVSLAQNYNGTGKVWEQGDFNYDGIVGFSDLVALAQNYNQSLALGSFAALEDAGFGGEFASEWQLALSLVPEPATLAAIAGAGVIGLRRRRA